MCAIGRNLDQSVGANSPATAMLGTGAIGVSSGPGRRATLLTSAGGTTGAGAASIGGTILTGKPDAGGIGGGRSKNPVMQR